MNFLDPTSRFLVCIVLLSHGFSIYTSFATHLIQFTIWSHSYFPRIQTLVLIVLHYDLRILWTSLKLSSLNPTISSFEQFLYSLCCSALDDNRQNQQPILCYKNLLGWLYNLCGLTVFYILWPIWHSPKHQFMNMVLNFINN